jgi:ABC-type proline/glycine betaine transport system ATPase subunit
MMTPRSILMRRVLGALDASPSRIPVLLGGSGSGRTTLLHQLRDRVGRTSAQHIDVERIATTPERFLRAIVASSPFPVSEGSPAGPRAAFDTTLSG